jgi:hypothetical protein
MRHLMLLVTPEGWHSAVTDRWRFYEAFLSAAGAYATFCNVQVKKAANNVSQLTVRDSAS